MAQMLVEMLRSCENDNRYRAGLRMPVPRSTCMDSRLRHNVRGTCKDAKAEDTTLCYRRRRHQSAAGNQTRCQWHPHICPNFATSFLRT